MSLKLNPDTDKDQFIEDILNLLTLYKTFDLYRFNEKLLRLLNEYTGNPLRQVSIQVKPKNTGDFTISLIKRLRELCAKAEVYIGLKDSKHLIVDQVPVVFTKEEACIVKPALVQIGFAVRQGK